MENNSEINRTFGKVSVENPTEGIINILASMMGVEPTHVQLCPEFMEYIKGIENEKKEIKFLINPFYEKLLVENTRESIKKLRELIDVGKFIYHFGQGMRLISCDESPDFIINFNGEDIGLEHTGMYDDDVVEKVKVFRKLVEECEKELKEKETRLLGLFNIIIFPKRLDDIFPLNRTRTKMILIDLIQQKAGNHLSQLPEYIKDIVLTPHQILELTVGESYLVAELSVESLEARIKSKEQKITNYTSTRKLRKVWLLIVMDGVSSISSYKLDFESLPKEHIAFNRIFLFDSFSGAIVQGVVS
jgi:uncharacterized protein YlzI (FlbEa/FlbD family)